MMAWENYILIALCYGAGCFLSWRVGLRQGIHSATERTVKLVAKGSGKTVAEISQILLDLAKDKT